MGSAPFNVRYKGKNIKVIMSVMTCENEKLTFLCQMPKKDSFEIELTGIATWVIVGKPIISANLVELIGDAYVNSILDEKEVPEPKL